MSPQVATEHIYEYDEEGNATRLLVAKGDYVPAGMELPKGAPVEDEEVALTDAQAIILNSASPHLTQVQAEASVAENEASYAAGRAADAAASPHSTDYPVSGDAVAEGGYGEKAEAPSEEDAAKAKEKAEEAGDKAVPGPKEKDSSKSKGK